MAPVPQCRPVFGNGGHLGYVLPTASYPRGTLAESCGDCHKKHRVYSRVDWGLNPDSRFFSHIKEERLKPHAQLLPVPGFQHGARHSLDLVHEGQSVVLIY